MGQVVKIEDLIKREGWEIQGGKILCEAGEFPITHPVNIHLRMYRDLKNPDAKYRAMKAAHDYMWPNPLTWNYWTERRFREHCAGWNYITYAGGASSAKSHDAAKIVDLYYLASPKDRTVIVASTTLEALHSRIWGYIITLLNSSEIKIPLHYLRSSPPKLLFNKQDTIHGMFAAAAKKGDDATAISNWIGKHPKRGMLLVLDESPDLPLAITGAFPNLEAGLDEFQCMAIGNSLSKYDLHGVLSTPKAGWNSVDPMKDIKWLTTQKNGICLYFNAYESPRIHEPDPVKKKALRFLIDEKEIEEKSKIYGKDSDSFWRFVLGFWRVSSSDNIVISKEFIDEFDVFKTAEWSGIRELNFCAGLDPAFSTGGDQCVLRLGLLGMDVTGKIVLDFKGNSLLFKIKIIAQSEKSAELQIADQVIEILNNYNIPMQHLCMDANGQGRALGEVLKLRAKALRSPWKIYSTGVGDKTQKSFDVLIKSSYEMWTSFRGFIQYKQIMGMDEVTVYQLTSRLVEINKKNFKPQLENKASYKARMKGIMPSLARSPDEADAAALCLQSAILNFGFREGEVFPLENYNDEADIKYWTHQKELAMKQEDHGPMVLEANFAGRIEDLKGPFG